MHAGATDLTTTPARRLSTSFLARLRLLAETIFASEDGPPPQDRIDWLLAQAEDFILLAGPQVRTTITLATHAVNLVAPLTIGRLPPLARLTHRERVRALSTLEQTAAGAPVLALKALLAIPYYEHPDAAREVGFDGECLVAASRLGRRAT